MKNQPQQKQEVQQSNNSKFRTMAIIYLDILVRSIISFVFIGLVLAIIFMGIFHWSWIIVLPLIFIVSIIVAPFLAKIRLGEKVFNYYEGILKKSFKLDNV